MSEARRNRTAEIILRIVQGKRRGEIADEFGVSRSRISQIKTWYEQQVGNLTPTEFAHRACVSRPTVYAALHDGRLRRPLTAAQLATFQVRAAGRPRKQR